MPHINKQEIIKQDKELMTELEKMYLNKVTCNEMSKYILNKRGLEVGASTINKMLIEVFGYRVGKVRDLSTPEIIEKISQWQIDGYGVKEIRRKLDKELGIKTSVPTIYRALGTARTIEMPKKIANKKILLVEDGSVDVEKLENDGFYVIVYKQGSNKPEFLR